MLRAYKDHLKTLSKKNEEEFQKRVQVRLQFRVRPEEETSHVDGIRSLILVMPDLIGQIQAWSKETGIPKAEKNLIGYLMTFLRPPESVIPYHSVGLFGYLEDAYLTGSIFKRISQYLSDPAQPSTAPGSYLFMKQVPVWLDYAKKVIPTETRKIDVMLDELLNNQTETFNQMVAQRHGLDHAWSSRVHSAIEKLSRTTRPTPPLNPQIAAG